MPVTLGSKELCTY